jgi:hypothetical protein
VSRKDVSDAVVVQACKDFHAGPRGVIRPASAQLVMQRTGQPWKVVLAAMERACNRGLIEYGVSLGTAWPTEKGLELLAPCLAVTNHREGTEDTRS